MTSFPQHWDDGTTTDGPDHQVHWYDDRTAIVRQSLRTNFEGPFLYLLLGTERALLLDTGTRHANLRAVADELLAGRDLDLVVAHTHGHGDHIGGDDQFAGRERTQVVGLTVDDVSAYFGIGSWPDENGRLDLGERVLDVIPIPGHQGSDVALYDRRTRLLLTGDSLYPGRLYVADWPAYRASVARLAGFVAAGNPVTWVLGAHIEMTARPGVDFPMGADRHPGEHELELAPGVLTELAEVMAAAGESPERIVREHFVVQPV
ncbi:MBL fold metallo-hydrolase [Kribbella sp. DT2]|uniref:MBL fold metallo-hydrolase n=1 Tax=Kribbella sp. DT2 TaxID=3393427 RepID=UPI003CE8CBA5